MTQHDTHGDESDHNDDYNNIIYYNYNLRIRKVMKHEDEDEDDR